MNAVTFHAWKTSISRSREEKLPRSSVPRAAASLRCCAPSNRMYALYPKQEARGEIYIDGEDILSPRQDLNRLRAKVGMVFQKPTPFPMSIHDNIAFGVRVV